MQHDYILVLQENFCFHMLALIAYIYVCIIQNWLSLVSLMLKNGGENHFSKDIFTAKPSSNFFGYNFCSQSKRSNPLTEYFNLILVFCKLLRHGALYWCFILVLCACALYWCLVLVLRPGAGFGLVLASVCCMFQSGACFGQVLRPSIDPWGITIYIYKE